MPSPDSSTDLSRTADMADRKKPGWAFWTTVVLVGGPFLYVASFGPACWLGDRVGWPSDHTLVKIYAPVLEEVRSEAITSVLSWYADLGARRGGRFTALLLTKMMEKLVFHSGGANLSYEETMKRLKRAAIEAGGITDEEPILIDPESVSEPMP